MATTVPVTLDTLITIKVSIQGSNRKFKIPLRDLGANVLPAKLRYLLSIPANQQVVFERYSDSAGAYITLNADNPQVYKTLFRAAKAKLKLRLRATIQPDPSEKTTPTPEPSPSKTPAAEASSSSSTSTVMPPAVPPPVPSSRPHSIAAVPAPPAQMSTRSYGLTPAIAAQWSRGRLDHTASMSDLKANMENKRKTLHNVASVADIKRESPTYQPFSSRRQFFTEMANISRERDLALRVRELKAPSVDPPTCAWSIYCNHCDKPMVNEHYHCSICDDNDYDLCKACVDAGVHCPGQGHWLVKRFVENGQVVSSTTERIAPKLKTPVKPEAEAEQEKEKEPEVPGAFTDEKKIIEEPPEVEAEVPTRTCNSCVKVFSEAEFVTCVTCDDYDLCIPCHVSAKHGHHPGHAFKPATTETLIGPLAEFLCAPGRNVRHSAVCDGCDKFIHGIRHKCLNCPDWDYCSDCVKNVKYIHPQHRFAPIYDPLPEPRNYGARHVGIFCDGPLCKGKADSSYIDGIRYKCAVCHDLDFCANCEAAPSNRHNRTHPLIKFKTPVRNVSVTTMGEDKNGQVMTTMGDQPSRSEASPTSPVSNAATQVQTIAELKPTARSPPRPAKEKIEIKDLLTEPIQEKIKVEDLLSTPVPDCSRIAEPVKVEGKTEAAPKPVPSSELNAHFVRDTIQDGTSVLPNQRFIQVWTLRNPGPHTWPAGCSVRYTGGDSMLNVDHRHPSSATEIAEATESNVVGRPVEVNEEIAFRVLMKAPKREGTAISYWRLKAADGTPFGHRLWCHIDVKDKSVQPGPSTPSQPPAYVMAMRPTNDPTPNANPALPPSDYSMQLMLLEMENKKRLMMARREKEEAETARQADVEKEQKTKTDFETMSRRRELLRDIARGQIQTQQDRDEKKEQMRRMLRQQVHQRILASRARTAERAENSMGSGPSQSTLVPIPISSPEPVKVQEKQVAPSAEKEVVEPQPIAQPDLQPTVEDVSSVMSEAGDSVVASPDSISEPDHEVKQEQIQGSDMVFPRLEKESPVSSTHEAVTAPTSVTAPSSPSVKSETATVMSPSARSVDTGFFEDAESVDVLDDSDGDGFNTDEEYDILDASDEEFV